MSLRRVAWSACFASAFAAAPDSMCHAQAFPARPIRVLITYAPGGATDITARVFAPRMADAFGQQVVVDNRPGASGIIATSILAKANPDGHTIILLDAAHAANPALNAKLPYDTLKDFAAINYVTQSPSLLLVHPGFPAKTVQELIAAAKAKPGQLNYGSAGPGSPIFLAMEQFKDAAGIDVQAISYKGGGPALTDLVGGQLPMMFISVVAGSAQVKAGRARALGVSSAKRIAHFPDLPTIAESGLPGFENYIWQIYLAPAGTPRAVILRINNELNTALTVPEVRERIQALGAEPVGGTPEQANDFIRKEVERWLRTLKQGARSAQ